MRIETSSAPSAAPRPLVRAALLALCGAAAGALAAGRAAAQPFSDPGPGIGMQGALEFPTAARGTNVSAGLHYRFRLTGGLGVEAAAGYRQVTYDIASGGSVRLQVVPVTGALLLFPWTGHPVQPYAVVGAGYYLVKIRGENVNGDVDGTENQFGFLAGAGIEAQASRRVSLFLDGRYTFLPVDTLKYLELEARYASVTFGVTLRY